MIVKKLLLLMATSLCLSTFSFNSYAQEGRKLPEHVLKSPDVKSLNTPELHTNTAPVIICLWETTCKPSINQLEVIAENYDDWKTQTGVRIIAVSADNSRTSVKVKMTAGSQGWEFEIFLDINQDFKRAMNAAICPTTFLIDKNGNIVWQKSGYAPGDENILLAELLKIK